MAGMAIPSGEHSARTLATLRFARVDTALSTRLRGQPWVERALSDYLDDLFAQSNPSEVLPAPLIQLIVDSLLDLAHRVDPSQLVLDLAS